MAGAEMIAAERQRQIDEEGWTAEHDDQHVGGELSMAAACYAAPGPILIQREYANGRGVVYEDPWPFGRFVSHDMGDALDVWVQGQKKEYPSRIRELIVAGALIAAEIDRLLRREAQEALF